MKNLSLPEKTILPLLLFFSLTSSVSAFDVDEWFDLENNSQTKSNGDIEESKLIESSAYRINAGDILEIDVWREPDLNKDVIVRPDGAISVPMLGEVPARGKTIIEMQNYIATELEKYIPEPVVTISTKNIMGNKIFVVGNVNRPGEIIMNQRLDVMQALGIAGGTSTFADQNKIKILRRINEKQVVIPFRYDDVEKGINLDQNILLLSGDVLIVP